LVVDVPAVATYCPAAQTVHAVHEGTFVPVE
jgi:hypothetical protein